MTPVVCKISGPMGGGFLYTTGAEAENSAVDLRNSSAATVYQNQSPADTLAIHSRDKPRHPENWSKFAPPRPKKKLNLLPLICLVLLSFYQLFSNFRIL